MRSSPVILIALAAFMQGCADSSTRIPGFSIEKLDEEWRSMLPLDTTQWLDRMALRDQATTTALDPSTTSIAWRGNIDTIVTVYTMWACTCPDFVVADSMGLGTDAVYVLPASDSVSLPQPMEVSGNRFELIGQRSLKRLKPARTMGPPEAGYFFRFTSYRIIRPYRVWGPHVFDASADTSAGEEPWIPSQLTVR